MGCLWRKPLYRLRGLLKTAAGVWQPEIICLNVYKIKNLIRWSFVSPIVQYLQFFLQFPNAPMEHLEEPWRSFLFDMRDSLEDWTREIQLPDDFTGMSERAATEEIDIVMRYVLRTHERRKAYLDRLEELDQIPLRIRPEDREEIIERLRFSGRSDSEIQRILGRECYESE